MSTENPAANESTARQGKIARLPHVIREEVNRRIQNGEAGKSIVDWLNLLPETQVILEARFDGRPISEGNLSQWKAGGYRDWVAKQEALDMARSFCADGPELSESGCLSENLAFRAAARIAIVLRDVEPSADPDREMELLEMLCRQILRLRRGERDAQWMQIERERLALHVKKFQEYCARANKSTGPKMEAIRKEDFQLMEKRDNML